MHPAATPTRPPSTPHAPSKATPVRCTVAPSGMVVPRYRLYVFPGEHLRYASAVQDEGGPTGPTHLYVRATPRRTFYRCVYKSIPCRLDSLQCGFVRKVSWITRRVNGCVFSDLFACAEEQYKISSLVHIPQTPLPPRNDWNP